MANGHGGKRANTGTKLGTVFAKTIQKAEARELARSIITRELEPILKAHARNAIGAHYMLIRNEDGTFRRAASEKDIDDALARGSGSFEILTQQPNTQSMQTLLAYALDKPKEQEVDLNIQGALEIRWKGDD